MQIKTYFLLFLVLNLPFLSILAISEQVLTAHFTYVTVSKYQILVSPYNMTDIVDLLKDAQNAIYIEVYELTYQDIAYVLADKAQSGVDVYLVLSGNVYGGIPSEEYSIVQYLNSSGVHVKFLKGFHYVHSKVFVIDNKTVIISTNNPTYSGLTHDLGVALVIYNSTIATWFSTIILNDYNEYFPNYNYPGLVISPINSYSQLYNLFSYPSSSIYAAFEEVYTDSGLTDALLSHQNVYVIASRTDLNIPTIQGLTAKIAVVGDYVYVGSINLSKSSVNSNRELGIIIMNDTLAKQMKSIIMSWYGTSTETSTTSTNTFDVYTIIFIIVILILIILLARLRR